MIERTNSRRYTQPQIQAKTNSLCNFGQLKTLECNSKISASNHINPLFGRIGLPSDYPLSGKHSRVSVLINCQNCNELTMTEVQYENGWATAIWCLLLSPFFCTGLCCVCMNSFKNVKHKCSVCRKQSGICQSNFI